MLIGNLSIVAKLTILYGITRPIPSIAIVGHCMEFKHSVRCSAWEEPFHAPAPMLRSVLIPQVLDINEEYSESLHGPPGNASAQSEAMQESSQSGEPPGSRKCGLTSV